MRAYVPDYDLVTPASLKEALDLLAREPGTWRPIAGGTDVMVVFNAGNLAHTRYLSIAGFEELTGIEVRDTHVRVGALVTYTEVRHHPLLRDEFPMLCQAAAESGAVAIQNRGTVGGNIANASPAADTPPALLAYDADIELISKSGTRRRPYRGFHTGYKQMDLKPEELVLAVHLPRRPGQRHYYRKVGTRKAQAISKVCLAASARLDGGVAREVRLAFGSVAPTVCACPATEALLEGRRPGEDLEQEIRAHLRREIAPIDDVRSTREYRLWVAENLAVDFWKSLEA